MPFRENQNTLKIKTLAFDFLSSLRTSIQNGQLLKIMIQLVQFAFLFVFIVHEHLLQFQKGKPYYQTQIEYFKNFLEDSVKSFYILETANILVVLEILSFVLFIFFSRRKSLLCQKIVKIIKIFAFINFLLLALLSVISFLMLVKIFQQEGTFKTLLFGTLPVVMCIIINFAIKDILLYGWFHAPLIFCLSFQNYFLDLIFLKLSVYRTFMVEKSFQKILYGQLFIFSLWTFLGSSTVKQESDDSLNSISLIYVPIMSILFFVIAFIFQDKLQIRGQNHNYQILCDLIKKCKTQNLKEDLTYQQLLKVFLLLQPKHKNSDRFNKKKNEQLFGKEIKKLNKSQVLSAFIQAIELQIQKKSSIRLNLMLLQLKLMRKDSVLSIFKLVQTIKKENKKNVNLALEFQIFIAIQKAQKQVFHQGKSKNQQKGFQVIEAQKICENFHSSFQKIIVLLHSFWTLMSKKTLNQHTLDEKFDEILDEEIKIEAYYQKLIALNKAPVQENMYKIVQSYLCNYKVQQFNQICNDDQDQSQGIPSYMIFDQQKIFSVSFQLLEDLNCRNQDIINQNKNIVFSQVFSGYVDIKIEELLMSKESQQFIVPIFNNKKNLILKIAKLYIYPRLQQKMKFLISFKKVKKHHQPPIIIYSLNSDTIQFYNEAFIKKFSIDQQRFFKQISKNKLVSQDIFRQIDLASQDTRQELKIGKTLNFVINTKNFSYQLKGNKVLANIKLIQHVQINGQTYMILKVKKGNGSTNMTIKYIETDRHFVESQASCTNLAKYYEKQTFFCKIPNSYQAKVQQKQVQIDDKSRISFLLYFYIFFLVAIACTFSQAIYSKSFSQSRISQYQYYSYAVSNVSEQYAVLFQSISGAFKSYHASHYPTQYLIYNVTNPFFFSFLWSFVSDLYAKQAQKIIIQYLSQQPNTKLFYNLTFDYFNVTTNTTSSTLLDFIQNLKIFVANGKLDFLLKNYISFWKLTIQFETSFFYQEIINQMISGGQKLYLLFIILIIVSLSLCIWILIKIEQGIASVYQILGMVQSNEAKKILDSIQKIMQNKHINPHQKDKILVDTEKSLKYLNNDFQNQNKQTQKNQIECQSQQSQLIWSGQKNSSHFMNALKQKKKKMSQNSNQQIEKIKKNSFLMNFLKYAIILIFACVYAFMITDDYVAINIEKVQIFQMLTYQINLYKTLIRIKRSQPSNFFQQLYTVYFNQTITLPFDMQSNQLLTYFQTDLPSYFDQFKKNQSNLLYGDICQGSIGKAGTPAGMNLPCSQVMNGIFRQGYSKVYQAYLLVSKQVRKIPLSKFYDSFCTVDKCPPYQNSFYCTYLIGQLIRADIVMFAEAIQQYQNIILNNNHSKFIRNLLVIMSLFSIFIFTAYKMKIFCRRCIRYFTFIPKTILFQSKILNFIKNSQILSKIDYL